MRVSGDPVDGPLGDLLLWCPRLSDRAREAAPEATSAEPSHDAVALFRGARQRLVQLDVQPPRLNGPIPQPADFSYICGESLAELERARPDVRVINLETAVTTSDDRWPGKAIHYRMHPDNIPCITAARIDCCLLANNHVLDWGYRGIPSE